MSEIEPIAKEVADIIWDAFKCRPITLDKKGRCNYIVALSLARILVRMALERGVEDPLHEIDWISVLDPDLSPEENERLFLEWLESKGFSSPPPSKEIDDIIAQLKKEVEFLKGYIEYAPEEERSEIEEQIKEFENEIRELESKMKKRVSTRREKKVKKEQPRVTERDEESLKRAIEDVIRSRVKVYRIDWSGMYARISTHRRYVEELEDIVRELGGRVVNRRFSGNLAIVTADFSKATVPREMRITKEQALSYFINKVISLARERNVSIDIGEVYSMFEDEWPAMEGLSDEEKIRMLDLMAEDYVRTRSEEERMPPPPPAAPVSGGRGVAMAPSYERPPTPPQAYRAFSPRNLTPEDWYAILNEGLVEWFRRYGTRYGITEFELPTIAKELVNYLATLGANMMDTASNIRQWQAGYILYNYSARAISQYYGEPLTRLIWRGDVYDELRAQLNNWYDVYGRNILKYSPFDVTFIIKQRKRTLRRAGFRTYLDNVLYIIYQRLGIKPTKTMEKEWVCFNEWIREGGSEKVVYC